VSIKNPSNLNLSLGDLSKLGFSIWKEWLLMACVTIALQLFRDESVLGTATMPNLTLLIGENNVTASSVFDVSWLCTIIPDQ
jgi:hypothetical protein